MKEITKLENLSKKVYLKYVVGKTNHGKNKKIKRFKDLVRGVYYTFEYAVNDEDDLDIEVYYYRNKKSKIIDESLYFKYSVLVSNNTKAVICPDYLSKEDLKSLRMSTTEEILDYNITLNEYNTK